MILTTTVQSPTMARSEIMIYQAVPSPTTEKLTTKAPSPLTAPSTTKAPSSTTTKAPS